MSDFQRFFFVSLKDKKQPLSTCDQRLFTPKSNKLFQEKYQELKK